MELTQYAEAILLNRFGMGDIREIPQFMVTETSMLATVLGLALESERIDLPTATTIFQNIEKIFVERSVTLNSADPEQNIEVNDLVVAQIAELAK